MNLILEIVLEGGDGVIVDGEHTPLGVGDGGVGRSRSIVAQKGLHVGGLRCRGGLQEIVAGARFEETGQCVLLEP